MRPHSRNARRAWSFCRRRCWKVFRTHPTGGVETDAKADIWTNFDDFKSKLDDLVTEAKNLNEAAKTGDETKMRDQFKKTAEACKACHEKYKAN